MSGDDQSVDSIILTQVLQLSKDFGTVVAQIRALEKRQAAQDKQLKSLLHKCNDTTNKLSQFMGQMEGRFAVEDRTNVSQVNVSGSAQNVMENTGDVKREE